MARRRRAFGEVSECASNMCVVVNCNWEKRAEAITGEVSGISNCDKVDWVRKRGEESNSAREQAGDGNVKPIHDTIDVYTFDGK